MHYWTNVLRDSLLGCFVITILRYLKLGNIDREDWDRVEVMNLEAGSINTDFCLLNLRPKYSSHSSIFWMARKGLYLEEKMLSHRHISLSVVYLRLMLVKCSNCHVTSKNLRENRRQVCNLASGPWGGKRMVKWIHCSTAVPAN